jgi:hypothetical protein
MAWRSFVVTTLTLVLAAYPLPPSSVGPHYRARRKWKGGVGESSRAGTFRREGIGCSHS